MMIRRSLILTLLCFLLSLSALLLHRQQQAPLGLSLETPLRILGKPLKTFDRLITRVVHVTPEQEQRLAGNFLSGLEKRCLIYQLNQELKTERSMEKRKGIHHLKEKAVRVEGYLQRLLDELAKRHNPRGLAYRVFLVDGGPNAHALPGGLISITTGMVDLLQNESQIVAVLAHEKGHIDLGHGLDRLRFMATSPDLDNLNFSNLAKGLVDIFFTLLLNHTYSKTQEYEADFYAYETLLSLGYDPEGQGQSDLRLLDLKKHPQPTQRLKKSPTNPISDYLKTHPSSEIRSENFINRAQRFKTLHPNKTFYKGERNYREWLSRFEKEYDEEFSK